MSDPTPDTAPQAPSIPIKKIVIRGIFLTLFGVSIYFLGPQIMDVIATAPRLGELDWWWFGVMAIFMTLSFFAAWGLTRIAVPEISWFLAATSQLATNSVSRVVPGGAVPGAALYYRMLSVTGINPANAATALAASSLLSTMVLLALPAVAAIGAALFAPVPDGLIPVAIGGAVVFVLLFAVVFVLVAFDKPLSLIGALTSRVVAWFAKRFHQEWEVSPQEFIDRRDEIVEGLGTRWHMALGASAANWLFDYLTLVAALWAVGSRPRLSLVLLAFTASALLTMIPITPGGLGFVEVGLTAMLALAGVSSGDALLATLAYRLYSFWLPIPAGGVAWLLFKRKYGKPPEQIESTA